MRLGSKKCAKEIARKKGPRKLKREARFKKSAEEITLIKRLKNRNMGLRNTRSGSKKGAEDITRRKGLNKLKYEARFEKGAKEITLRKGPKTTKKNLEYGAKK